MMEIEQKYRIEDSRAIEGILTQLGAEFLVEEIHSDLYLNAPDRDFAATDEVLRLRVIDGKPILTYKGAKQSKEFKVRREVELPFQDEANLAERIVELFRCLRFRPVAEVRKTRQVWRCPFEGVAVTVCIDRLADIGEFLELEAIAESEDYPKVRQALLKAESSLKLTNREDKSYLRMVLES